VSSTPTPAFDGKGGLWVVFTEADHVWLVRSPDLGRTFGPAVRVTRAAEKVDANGEARPKIAFGSRGEIYLAWTRKGRLPYTGDIRFTRSLDGGRTFDAPRTLNDDGLDTGHRFESLAVTPAGEVFLAWIDKRDLEAAKARGADYPGGAVYYAVSADRGKTFGVNRKLKDNACECCRLAVAVAPAGPVLLWRDILAGDVRDHSMVRWSKDGPGPVARATFDEWAINACPHHGPALAVAPDGTDHLAWFSAGTKAEGLLYTRSTNGGGTFSPPFAFGSVSASSHPQVAAGGKGVFLAWKESLAAGGTAVMARVSRDDGRSWSEAREVLRTDGSSDHPLLVRRGDEVVLSWFTVREGLRLAPLEALAGTT
jgi:hypothetical protein